jgi:unspecific monooxygenase
MNAPGGIDRVLVSNAANYRRTPATIRILRPLVGQGLFLSEGEDWRLQRRSIAPALAPRVIPILARHIATVGIEALGRLEAEADRPVDLLAAMQFLALEIAGRSMFSLEMGRYGAPMRRMITGYGAKLGQPYLFDMLLPPWIPTLRDLRRRRFRARWTLLMDSIMAARLALPAGDAPQELFDLLRAARDLESGQGFTQAELRDQISTMIVAGHETTALALFWSLYLLASSPAAQQRLADEVRDIAITPEIAGKVLGKLTYARAVVSEALRLYPPAFVIVREAIAADSYAGAQIPAGSQVLIAPWVLHRHRKFWANPDAFDPGRFLEGAPPQPRLAYLPFGVGPRVCIGAHFAMAEAVLILAMMVQRFRITRADSVPVLPMAVVTTVPSYAAPFRLEVR